MIYNNISKLTHKNDFLKEMVDMMKKTENTLVDKISTLEKDAGVSLTIFSQIFEVTSSVPTIYFHETLSFQLTLENKFAEGYKRLSEIKVLHEVRNISLEQKSELKIVKIAHTYFRSFFVCFKGILTRWPDLGEPESKNIKRAGKHYTVFCDSFRAVMKDLENAQKTIKNKSDEITNQLQSLFEGITRESLNPEQLIQNLQSVLHDLESNVRSGLGTVERLCKEELLKVIEEEEQLKEDLIRMREIFNKIIDEYELKDENKMNVSEIKLLSDSERDKKVRKATKAISEVLDMPEKFPLESQSGDQAKGNLLNILTKEELKKKIQELSPASTSFNFENMSDKEVGILIKKMKAFNEEEEQDQNSDSEGEYEYYVESTDTEAQLKERKKKIRQLKKSVEDLLPHAALKTRRPYHAGDFAPADTSRRNCAKRKISGKLFENIEAKLAEKFGEGGENKMHDEKKRSHITADFRDNVNSPRDLTPIVDQIPTKFRCVYEDCGKTFPDVTRVSLHYIQKHSEHVPARKKRIHACHHCAKLFVTSKDARECAKSHFPYQTGKSYYCMLCLYDNHEAAIKTSEGHLLDHLMAKHRKNVKRPYHACAVCDTSQNSTMKRGVCQNHCLKKSKKPTWSCKTCEKDFASYREKVEHFLENDKDGQEHDLFRLYLVEPGNTKRLEKNDDNDSVVSLRKGKNKLSIKVLDKENPLKRKVTCPRCTGLVAERPAWTYESEDEMLLKLKKHFRNSHKEKDIRAYLNETQQRLFDVLEDDQEEEEVQTEENATVSEDSQD